MRLFSIPIIALAILLPAGRLGAFPNSPVPSRKVLIDSLFTSGGRHHEAARRLLKEGNRSQAMKEFMAATELFREYQDLVNGGTDSIVAVFGKLLEEEPSSPVYNYLLGRYVQVHGSDSAEMTKAKTVLQKAVDIEPKYPWSYVAMAYPYFQRGDYTSAMTYYRKAVGVDSTFGVGYSQLQACCEKLGQAEERGRINELAIKNIPEFENAWFFWLDKARRQTEPRKKIELYREMIGRAAREELASDTYSEMLHDVANSNSDSAAAIAESAKLLKGDQFRRARQAAYTYLWNRALQKNNGAIIGLAKGIRQTDDAYLNSIAGRYLLDSMHNTGEALQSLNRAYEVCTTEHALNTLIAGSNITRELLEKTAANFVVWIANDLGRLYDEIHDYPQAERYLTIASKGTQDARIPQAYFRLATTQLTLGRKEDAVQSLARGLSIEENEQAMEKLVGLVGGKDAARDQIKRMRHVTVLSAPDFELKSLQGETVRLSGLRGKVVLIDFWATWCGPCKIEMPHLQRLHENFAAKTDVQFLSISTDGDRALVKPFIEQHRYPMKVLYSEGTDQQYGVNAIPTIFLIDREGKIQYKHVGFSGSGEEFIKKMSAEIDELLSYRPGVK